MAYNPFNTEATEAERATRSDVEQLRRTNELADVLYLMTDAAGRRLAYRLLSNAGVFRTTFVPGDPHGTSFNEGQRSLGLWLLSEIMEIAGAQYTQMLEEAKNAN